MKKKTNVQCVKDIMEFSNYGALAQAFVMDALSKLSNAVSESDPKMFDNPFLNGEAWVGVAREIKGKLDAHFAK